MKNFRIILFVLCLSILSLSNLQAEIEFPAIFTDNMVLQQQTDAAIWGWADAGKTVTVIPSWDKKKYTAKADEAGKWKLKVTTPVYGGPYEISISDGKVVTLKNVLIGEVWLCSGQSNMEVPMKGYKGQPIIGSQDAILKSRNKNIRVITVPKKASSEPLNDFKGQWQEASPEVIAEFSATGYFFGRLLNEVLDVPIGLIGDSYGGTCIEAWMSKNTSNPFEDLPLPQKGDTIKVPNHTPTGLFNGMLSPVIGYSIKGAIWYQGESNMKGYDRYARQMLTMVTEWRTLWGIGEFPFFYAQIAPYNYKISNKPDWVPVNSAHVRDAQRLAMDMIPNCAMVSLMDIGEETCIHPSAKEVGSKRLAYCALGKTYGIKGIQYACPTLDTLVVKDSAAIVSFKNIPLGLTSFNKELKCFEIAGDDKVFYPATSKLGKRNTVVTLTATEVKKPVAVRYAYKDFIVGDLFSIEGLPVSSFRTDNW